jgi:integrase
MSLTELAVRKALPREKAYKLADSRGLFLFVSTTGARSWRFKFRFEGKERLLTFGLYPEVKLAEARQRTDDARTAMRSGLNPSAKAKQPTDHVSFEMVARDWFKRKSGQWAPQHALDVIGSLEKDVFKAIGGTAINAIPVRDVLAVLRVIEERGAIETAHRIRQRIEAIYAFAIASGLAESNPGAVAKGALTKIPASTRQPAITSLSEARTMLADGLAQRAQPMTGEALLLLALTAVRPGELRAARWAQFAEEAEAPLWTIPASQMKGDQQRKAGAPHLVPLSPPAVACLRRLRALTGNGELVFPSIRHAHLPISENAIGYLLNRAGHHGRQTAHGLRATFSSIMNERFPADRAVIDMMLAHVPKGQSSSETAYNRATHLTRRRELANEWAALLVG